MRPYCHARGSFGGAKRLSSFVANAGGRRLMRGLERGELRRCRMRREAQVVRSEMGGEYMESFEDVEKHMTDLFTYKAVRVVLSQLKETDPTTYRWLYDFTVENKPSNSYEYCKLLAKDNYELGERVLGARLNLLAEWMEKLPSQREKILLRVRDTNLEILRGLIRDSVNLNFTAKPRPDLDE